MCNRPFNVSKLTRMFVVHHCREAWCHDDNDSDYNDDIYEVIAKMFFVVGKLSFIIWLCPCF